MTGIDWSKCPICETNPKKMGGVYTVRGWRMSAESLIENYDDGLTADQIADWFSLPIEDVKDIVEYAEQARSVAHSL